MNGSSVELHEMAHDGKPEPHPSLRLRTRVRAAEPAEDLRELLGRDSLAGVAHLDLDEGVVAGESDVDPPPLGVNLIA